MVLTQKIGDDAIHRIPLRWGKASFTPGTQAPDTWNLIFTLKADVNDVDTQAKIQKQSGTGIVHSGSNALVAIVPTNTTGGTFTPVGAGSPVTVAALAAGTYHWDVQAQNLTTQEVRTVADGTMVLIRDLTRSTTTSVPMYVSQAPAPTTGATGLTGATGEAGATETPASILAKMQAFDTTQEGLARVAIGSEHLTRTVAEGVPVNSSITGGTYAEGEYDFDGVVPGDGYVRYVQGQAFTWRNAPSGPYEITANSPSFPTSEASSFAATVNNSPIGDIVSAVADGTKVTLTAIFTGEIYNDNVGIGVIGELLGVMSGGTDGETIAVTPTPTHLGQWCRFGDAAPYDWYQANTLTSWVFRFTDGESGAVDSAALAALAAADPAGFKAVLISLGVLINA